ncbi:hypothetical protein EMIHUDRAFT_247964 [Emiliania huxleyi CCMP1516]|uniref:Uncharacterized protein n=2 Tax=Emiliania huxleyi TaxID=2903 RepID=A0A0D3IJ44_EMIH1|nr:hypothetical protein EMIHUDRAFT_247964 [Emiliania huxleyi CCMP1516]EOD11279.1 hypothetical protein EMIHUDRAFT_247964 [Emiliania huxleyi CCMP1516]|eukprot:XP_005763708.1 hypothetical protein EMIHUDRAFT_247964 [Emiliania huxleyi CCMP1516]
MPAAGVAICFRAFESVPTSGLQGSHLNLSQASAQRQGGGIFLVNNKAVNRGEMPSKSELREHMLSRPSRTAVTIYPTSIVDGNLENCASKVAQIRLSRRAELVSPVRQLALLHSRACLTGSC